jgi:hypothetical protein
VDGFFASGLASRRDDVGKPFWDFWSTTFVAALHTTKSKAWVIRKHVDKVKIELQNKTNMSIYQGMMLKIISSLFQ